MSQDQKDQDERTRARHECNEAEGIPDFNVNVNINIRSMPDQTLTQFLSQMFANVFQQLNALTQQGVKIMASLDQVVQDVTDESTLEDSIITLLTNVQAQLAAILAGNLPPDVQAKVDAVFASLEANKTKLAAAVAANTPAPPPAPPTPTT